MAAIQCLNKLVPLSSIIIKFSQRMLLRTHKKSPSNLTFASELASLKPKRQSSSNLTKNEEYYKIMTSILDLLLGSYPSLTSQLLILKQSLMKWHEYLTEESNRKNQEMMQLREDLSLYVSKEIGIVLEEIGYYVKYLSEHYQDEDMRRLYVHYLTAIKKLEWDRDPIQAQVRTTNQQMQTDPEEPPFLTLKSIKMSHPHSTSQDTIDSPSSRLGSIEMHRYIKIKEENLDLQRKIDQLNSKISELSTENKSLKKEIDRLFDENQQFRLNKAKSLDEIEKLKELMQDLKSEELQRRQGEEMKRISYSLAENKYEHLDNIKQELHHTLESAESELLRREEEISLDEQERYLKNNYITTVLPEQSYKTLKKQPKMSEYSDVNSQLRMMLVQALALESYINNSSIDYQQ